MRHLVRLAVLVLLVPVAGFASEWEIDTAHSTAAFSVKHMMVSNVRGSFGKVTGTVNLDDKNPAKSTVEATLDATTINTGLTARDEHLKSPDFFDVKQFPTITFKSTKVTGGKGKYKVAGDLTMHGVTKPVTLDVDAPDTEIQDPMMHATKRGASATAKLNRKEFGLTYNAALEKGGVAVGEEISITIDVELVKKGSAPAATAKDVK